jgi:thiol-disulfide isomerase/thioredoxin
MKTSLLAFSLTAVLALAACSQAETPKAEMPAAKTTAVQVMNIKTKAVLIYADWCGSCKALDPKIKKARAMGPVPGLDFVTLDYTAKDAKAFYAQADAAGVGEAVRAHMDGKIKTGELLLIDLDDKKIVGTVTQALEPAEIITALKDAVKAS